ncbi:MAG: WecB/TagA/CpsF family glycosyltransferase [Phycisphaerae bacterium]|nr:WecB/TagA/CpsF family glycosyltransferase [Phycisphaerae bacterium]
MSNTTVRHTSVLGVPVTCFCSYDHATEYIVDRIRRKNKTLCIAINPEKVRFARGDAAFGAIVRDAHVHICDGIGAAIAVQWITGWRIPRVTGVRLFYELVKTAEREGLSVFLLGAKPQVNERAAEVLREKHPALRIAGMQDGYFKDADEVVRQINASGADLLFAAMGSPRQEQWLTEHSDALEVPFRMGVGGSFDVLTGRVKRAPAFFQRTGTEFLYRLICEPKRWRRQCKLPGFAARVAIEAVRERGIRAFILSRRIDTVSERAETEPA